MNTLIHFLAEKELSNTVYIVLLVLSFVGWFVFNYCYRKKYHLTGAQAIILSAVVFPLTYAWTYIIGFVESGFTNWDRHHIVWGFIYIPLFVWALAKVLKCNVKAAIDFIAPGVALSQAIAHIGCTFAGCCYGFSCSWGVWNPILDTTLFPVQICETIFAFATFFICIAYAKKHNYCADTRVYPLFLILFGITRFAMEFLRDNHKVFLHMSSPAIHCILMTIVGIVWLLYLRKSKQEGK